MMIFSIGAAIAMRLWNLSALVAIALFGLSMSPSQAREVVAFSGDFARGTVVVRTNERRLYLVMGDGKALRYKIGVGRAGRQWAGRTFVQGKHVNPNWIPPPAVRKDKPKLPGLVPAGSPQNPLGVRALTLSGGNYAIHGTNDPGSIGGFVSYGCIRMYNHDILDFYDRVTVGTPVVVTR
jgi:lipoprotein-anchoring transpeptidase ErfK/SrfK